MGSEQFDLVIFNRMMYDGVLEVVWLLLTIETQKKAAVEAVLAAISFADQW